MATNFVLYEDKISADWEAGNDSATKGDFFSYGEHVGFIMDQLIQPVDPLLYRHPVTVSLTPTWEAIIFAFIGAPIGYALAQMQHLYDCLADSDDMIYKIIDSGYKFADGTFTSVAQAFYDLGDFTNDIKGTIVNCPQTSEDAKHFGDINQTFASWGVFVYTVSLNLMGTGFWEEINAIGESARADDWFSYGAHIGAAIDLLFKPVDLSPWKNTEQ